MCLKHAINKLTKTSSIYFISYSRFFDDFSLLNQVIDWEIMQERYWADTEEDGDRKRRRRAEFLIYKSCP
ncbi:MAG: DarT ssDNA thymidine ADP-ribosyltransferase family protein [Microcoleaceae cyanobacterium]